ncbi:MAG: hypothetical protein ABJA66_19710, partial [Actinomycetota bacterium]
GEAWAGLLRDPGIFIRHWNYKGAILSGGLRAPIFLVTYLLSKESLKLALGAALAQFIFRFLFAGIGGALIQSFRRVEPAWKALLTILLIVPVISHLLEFILQFSFAYFTATDDHFEGIIRSICVSVLSALFSLFIMRRNVMIVGEADSKSLLSDIIRMPLMVYDFMAFIPHEIAAMLRRNEIIPAFLSVLGFGVFSQMICWAVTNKFTWTYRGGQTLPWLNYWAIDGIIVMVFCVSVSLLAGLRKNKQP